MTLAAVFQDAVDFLYPRRCASCSGTGDDAHFCAECAGQLESSANINCCPRCAMPIPEGAACGYCEGGGVYPFESIVAAGLFRHRMRNLVHQMKYHHRWPVAEILADWMLGNPRIASVVGQTDCLVPIPLHFSRQIARGYNQAEALARQLGRQTGVPVIRPIVRLATRRRRRTSAPGMIATRTFIRRLDWSPRRRFGESGLRWWMT